MPKTCWSIAAWLVVVATASADEAPRFARDVQPLLKRHCLKCHGPAKREGGLNLSTPAGIIRGGKNGAAVVPHDAQASLVVKRVADDQMPPDEPLPDADKETLRRWIAAGAPGLPAREKAGDASDGKDHWAFQALRTVSLPAVSDSTRLRNAVDRFIEAALENEQLTIGPEAGRGTLIRRVSFDLTGLPPAPEEIAAFLDDSSPDAYSQMVERYLASPHYGERWGKYWLDAAGYADSNGYFNADSDRPLAWRYRDWVVRAMNRDEPFDRFVREQIAGDELSSFIPGSDVSDETIEMLEATHYLRNGQDGSGESDGNPDEVRADRYYALESVVQNVTNSLFGLTVQCAKCHDHKFEPISQRDYYQLQAVFAPAFNLAQWLKPAERFVYAGRPGEFTAWEARVKSLDAELDVLRGRLAQWVREHRPRGQELLADAFDEPAASLADRWSSRAPGDDAPVGSGAVTIDAAEAPALVMQQGQLRILTKSGQPESWVSTREKFDWTPDEVGAAVQVTFDLVADRLDEAAKPAERVGFYVALHDFNDNSPVAGGNVLIDGNPGGPTTVYLDYPGADSKPIGEIGATPYKPGRNFGVRISHVEAGKYKLEQLVDFFQDGKSLMLAAADLPDGGFGFEHYSDRSFAIDNLVIERFSGSPQTLAAHEQFQKNHAAEKKPLDELHQIRANLKERPGKIAWVSDVSPTPPEVFLLERGDYGKPQVAVQPAGFSVLSDEQNRLDVHAPAVLKSSGRRLAFANWATAPGSVAAALLARVEVNRIWQHHFGVGIVATADNLGVTGALPSHPELLDWLAAEFAARAGTSPALDRQEGAWSLKRMHRLILNSAAYRQSGRDDARGKARDPDNRLLWRYPLRRLDAEAVRDALLAVSGDLDRTSGGPAVATKRDDSGEVVALDPKGPGRRRSIYLQQRRTSVVSFLAVFDAPSIVFNSAQRPLSTMPLQALALLNSQFVVDRAKGFAARLERAAPDEAARVRLAYSVAWGRAAGDAELEAALQFLASQESEYQPAPEARSRSWVDFCQMLLASNEFLYIE
ncbi:MAG TPA: PSD1 and planctomycete cytochrome C domain-containing protein [Planctomycetaceae bacterium]|nr:PSD1 and planctomycete cytochrome C domain-containing protein [Planctomycetaceae bacterium]